MNAPQEVSFVELKTPTFLESVTSNFQPAVIVRQGSTILEISNHASHELLSILGGLLNAK